MIHITSNGAYIAVGPHKYTTYNKYISSFRNYFYENLGLQIRRYREQQGLTQEQLSVLLCKNEKYIGHIERHERDISLKVLVELMDFLHIQPADLCAFDKKYNWK